MNQQDNRSQSIDYLLANKLERPVIDMRIVRRADLTEMLKLSLQRRLTLLIAPTGYGKTTLLVEWLSTFNSNNHREVWVRLDQFDNTPLRFWAYIVSGLKKVSPQFHIITQQIIQQEQSPEDLTLLNPLINAINTIPYNITLVLDNYHTITNDSIQRQLSYFVDHLPHNLNLIISSRAKLPIPLSRLRAQRKLLELTEHQLAFSLSETQAFLTNVMNLDITQEQIIALWNTTEGWVAGLQLAALSYTASSQTRLTASDILQDNRLVLDYLTEEVLNQQSPSVREFLLKSAILEELSAPLCNAILDRDDSETLLAQIEAANLFVIGLDNTNGYRYHALFAQTLQTRLKQTYPQEVTKLHLKACNWLLENGTPYKAISHAIAADNLEKAAEIVDMCATEAVLNSDLVQLLGWMYHFSKNRDVLIKHPRIGIYCALANYHLQRLDQVESMLGDIEQILADGQPYNETARLYQWQLSTIRAVLECSQGDQEKGVSDLHEALATHPPEDFYFYTFITHTLAVTYKDLGNLEAAINAYADGYQHALKNNSPSAIHSLCSLAKVLKKQGRLHQAKQRYKEAFDLIDTLQPDVNTIALALTGLLEITFEQNDTEQADYWAAEVIDNYHQIMSTPSAWAWLGLTSSDFVLVRYYLALGEIDEALHHFNDLKKYVPENLVAAPDMLQNLIEAQALISLATNDIELKGQLLSEVETVLHSKTELTPIEQLTLARIYAETQRVKQAKTLLEKLESTLSNTAEQEYLIRTLVLKALVCAELGQEEQALQALDDGLLLAEPAGYVRIFINEGETMKYLLEQYASIPIDENLQSYVQWLIAAFNTKSQPITDEAANTLPEATKLNAVTPQLSQRELEILQMLTTSQSYKEIAATLTISVNTVKIHVKNIYRKLDTHSRKGALERAREINALEGL